MAIFFTSDTHYGHAKILEYCNRPFPDADTMDKIMIERWNAVVRPEDYVFHLGDFAMGSNLAERTAAIRKRLNGDITIVLGNHDRSANFYRTAGFQDARSSWSGFMPPQSKCKILMRHRPPERPLPEHAEYDLILCGHVHEKWLHRGKVVNVGVDQWGFRPVTLEALLKVNEPGYVHSRWQPDGH